MQTLDVEDSCCRFFLFNQNDIVSILEQYKISSLLQQYLSIKLGMVNILVELNQRVIAVGQLKHNIIHPYREYIAIHIEPEYYQQKLASLILAILQKQSVTKILQCNLSMHQHCLIELIENNGFQRVRTCQMLRIGAAQYLHHDLSLYHPIHSMNSLDAKQLGQLQQLVFNNYLTFHRDINPLSQEIDAQQFFVLLQDIDLEYSFIVFDHDEMNILAYVLSAKNINPTMQTSLEVAYLGGDDDGQNITYIVQCLLYLFGFLFKNFEEITFEVDDTDKYATTLIKYLNVICEDIVYTYVKGRLSKHL